jgi:hypothetical protein
LAAFVAAFEALGYEECDTGALEDGYKKIAIYANSAGPQHAARQLHGRWTSKLGKDADIQHALDQLEGAEYGRVVKVMRKQRELSVLTTTAS